MSDKVINVDMISLQIIYLIHHQKQGIDLSMLAARLFFLIVNELFHYVFIKGSGDI